MAEKAQPEIKLILSKSKKGNAYYQVQIKIKDWRQFIFVDNINADYLANQCGLEIESHI